MAFAILGSGFGDWAEGQRRSAAYMVVLSLRGELKAIRPAGLVPTSDEKGPGTSSHGEFNRVFYNALKMRDPRHVLLGANYAGASGIGPMQAWDWVKDELVDLGNSTTGDRADATYSSHDLQWVTAHDYDQYLRPYLGDDDAIASGGLDAAETDARVWRPDATTNSIYVVDARDGTVMKTVGPFDHARTYDINHFQVLHDGTAIINGRVTGSFRKVDLATGRTLWTCGGVHGNFSVRDLSGKVWPAGEKFLWWGQHNLEYYGEGEFLMFDNGYNYGNNSFISATSRPLRLQLDETSMTATVSWAFETGVHSDVYGDADLLPTGHVVACYWPNKLSPAMKEQFDARVVEVVPSTLARNASAFDPSGLDDAALDDRLVSAADADSSSAAEDEVAWELLVRGHTCTEPQPKGCERSGGSQPIGWSMYAVERFYLAPLVHSARLVETDAASSSSSGAALICSADAAVEGDVRDLSDAVAPSAASTAAAFSATTAATAAANLARAFGAVGSGPSATTVSTANATLDVEFVAFDSFKVRPRSSRVNAIKSIFMAGRVRVERGRSCPVRIASLHNCKSQSRALAGPFGSSVTSRPKARGGSSATRRPALALRRPSSRAASSSSGRTGAQRPCARRSLRVSPPPRSAPTATARRGGSSSRTRCAPRPSHSHSRRETSRGAASGSRGGEGRRITWRERTDRSELRETSPPSRTYHSADNGPSSPLVTVGLLQPRGRARLRRVICSGSTGTYARHRAFVGARLSGGAHRQP